MIRNISFFVIEAKTRLSKVGLSLFYLYLLLYIGGFVGIFFGMVTLILKLFHIGAIAQTSLFDVIVFMLISCGMIKFFPQLIRSLLEIDASDEKLDSELKAEEIPQPRSGNVIPFKDRGIVGPSKIDKLYVSQHVKVNI